MHDVTTQLDLVFDAPDERERVASRIGRLIVAFCRRRLEDGAPEFRMAELNDFILARVSVAPDSPGRILRLLRRDKRVHVDLVDRRSSLYRVTRS